MCKLCVFAGTAEGRQLVERLRGRGAEITACVATQYGESLLGWRTDVRILSGSLDAAGMEALFRAEGFDAVVDATHPYASLATENISSACAAAGIEYLRLARSSSADAADGVFVPDARACAEYLRDTDGPILLTTGSKELPAFCGDAALKGRLYVRVLPVAASLRVCEECGIAPDHIIAMQGPFREDMNLVMLRAAQAKYLVTKDTGTAGGYEAKIAAARVAGVQVVVIGRPPQREGYTLDALDAALEARFQLGPVRKKVSLVGIGMGNPQTRTLGMERALREADCLIGAKRALDAVDCAGKRVYTAYIAGEVAGIIRAEKDCRRFAVLLSGDTGFYSGAKRLLRELKDADVEILPGISSLQYLCARLGRPWEDIRAVSLHGRDCDIVHEVRAHYEVFALVGGENGAGEAFSRLAAAGLGGLRAFVGERLGYPDERITDGTVSEMAGGCFDPLSVILVENPGAGSAVVTHGLPDEAFERDETPMTKSEVRSVCLSKLRLTRDAVVYDVGSGTGSVSVEAALMAAHGRVYAVEAKPQAAALTRRNAAKFHLENIEVIEGTAPEALEPLPAPTHAFVGGSSGNLRAIVDCLLARNPGVRVVATAVTMESIAELSEIARDFDECDIAEIAVAKPRALGRYRLMTAQNPVWVFAMWNRDGGAN